MKVTTLIKPYLTELHVFKIFCQQICIDDDIINLIAQCLLIKDIYNRVCNKNHFSQIPMMSQAANQIWKGHSCGLVLKLLHSWARWAGARQGGHGWPRANICPKHPVWPRESSLAGGKLSHLVRVSSVVGKGAAENGILSHCSSLDALSHGRPERGGKTGPWQRGPRKSSHCHGHVLVWHSRPQQGHWEEEGSREGLDW